MGPAQALREVKWTLEPVVLPVKGTLVAAFATPHPQADLDRLLQHLKALPLWREGDSKALCLFFVVAGADAEPGASPREYVERGHRLCQDGRVTKMHPHDHRREHSPLRDGGQERQGGIAFRFVGQRATHDRVLPDVVCHADAVEARLFRAPTDVREGPTEALRSSVPVEAVELQSELHEALPPSLATFTPQTRSLAVGRFPTRCIVGRQEAFSTPFEFDVFQRIRPQP